MPETAPPMPPIPERPAVADARDERSRQWLIPLACLLAAILLALTAFWAMAGLPAPPGGGSGDGGDPSSSGAGLVGADTGSGGGEAEQGGGSSAPTPGEGPTQGAETAGLPEPDADASPMAGAAGDGDAPAVSQPSIEPRRAAPELGFTVSLQPPSPPAPTPEPVAQAGGAASFFGQVGRGTRFVYVIDKSGSMAGDRFADATFELVRSIRSLRPHERFSVIFYDSAPEPMPFSGLIPATPANQERAIEWVRSVSVGGGTDPRQAMLIALEQLNPDTIWLLSDGQFSIEATDAIRAANPDARVQINTIAFHDRGGEAVLQRIARENDGDYRFVEP